jgi:uncharacterized protein (TIGR00255 family)
MSINSMTGFGRGEASARGIKAQVELSSVNRKQLDVRVNLPRSMACLEAKVQGLVSGALSRGSVSVTVYVTATGAGAGALRMDEAAAKACVSALRKSAAKLGLKDDLTARTLLNLPPEVTGLRRGEPDAAAAWPAIEQALRKALVDLLKTRKKEGIALQKDLLRRAKTLQKCLDRICELAPGVPVEYRQKLTARLEAAGLQMNPPPPELARELAIFADRCDISEEITRLRSHLTGIGDLLVSDKPAGRTLDFMAQETMREINTIGSKANNLDISKLVVTFKAELECVREQIQNVE